MKTLIEGIALALVLSLAMVPVYGLLGLRLAVCLGAGAYCFYLIWRQGSKLGRLVLSIATMGVVGIGLFAAISSLDLVILCLGYIWLLRSVLSYQSILSAGMDLGLCALSFLAAVWAYTESAELSYALWVFFLMQALSVFIPCRPFAVEKTQIHRDGFSQAKHQAEAALAKFS